jgi:hypothetical protein
MNKLNLENTLKPRFAIALALTTLATGFLAAACGNTSGGNTTASNQGGWLSRR